MEASELCVGGTADIGGPEILAELGLPAGVNPIQKTVRIDTKIHITYGRFDNLSNLKQ